jgi:repressor LexA
MGRTPLFEKSHALRAIQRLIIRRGVPPTIRELQHELGVRSTRTVRRYLELLEEAGELDRLPGSRGIKLRRSPGRQGEMISLPLVGTAPAGPLMLAEENLEAWVSVPREYVRSSSAKHFLLRVHGTSMNRAKVEGERIEDGDLVLIRQQSSADPNEVVVALIDGEATIKRLVHSRGHYLLQPQSSVRKHQPILVGEGFSVQGVVKRVIKQGSHLLQIAGD